MTTKAPIPPRRKLIEVALPLEAINRESAREKSIRHGHPSTLHLWWARRPLAACRAVLFASLVDDPSSDPQFRRPDGTVDEERAGEKRAELFNLIEELVKWENSSNPKVIDAARAEIARCIASRKIETGELAPHEPLTLRLPEPEWTGCPPRSLSATPWDFVLRRARPEAVNAFLAEFAPPVLDPFCGGGSIPLEAQRLGLRAFGSDLNPVAVLITRALIEIPPAFAGMPPVNPQSRGIGHRASGIGEGQTAETGGREIQGQLGTAWWRGAAGLAEDVRYYGRWMRDEASKRIGHLYPKITVTEAMARHRKDLKEYVGQELTVIAWLWARTVPSPNPAAEKAHVPLVRSFWLSTKEGKKAWVEPVIAPDRKSYRFEVRRGTPGKDFDPGTGTIGRKGGRCILTGAPMTFPHVRTEAKAGHMGVRLMAIVAEGTRERVYLSPTEEHVKIAESAKPTWRPEGEMPKKHRNFQPPVYGMNSFGDLFTPRQLVALTTFSDLVMEARARVLADARAAGIGAGRGGAAAAGSARSPATGSPSMPSDAPSMPSDGTIKGLNAPSMPLDGTSMPLDGTSEGSHAPSKGLTGTNKGSNAPFEGSDGASAGPSATENSVSGPPDMAERYADAVATYLAFGVDKCADYWCSLATWAAGGEFIRGTFARQALAMVWDFAECNPLSTSTANISGAMDWVELAIRQLPASSSGFALQHDAATAIDTHDSVAILTDPPYYDNIGYSDLSDFFYVWLRRSLNMVYPALFRTLLTPKAEELIATPYRHEGSAEMACEFFEVGLGKAFERMHQVQYSDLPLTVYYAFKQSETEEDNGDDQDSSASGSTTASTGWETMLQGLISAGFAITGTWPIRTERGSRSVGIGTNALASSIVLVCRPRPESAPMASRREFIAALKRELPGALRDLQSGNIAPVDLAQAAIGPGMAVYSRYSKVLEASGERLGVRTALALINQVLDEVLAEQEGEYDADTRWCIKWFEQFAHADGPYGDAETLCKAMAVAVNGLVEAGVVAARGGKVRLLRRTELMGGRPETWDPATDDDILHWEVCQYLCWALETGGEPAAANLLRRINAVYAGAAEVARDLAYRLYTLCERKKWAPEANAYNDLVMSWPEIQKLAAKGASSGAAAGVFGQPVE